MNRTVSFFIYICITICLMPLACDNVATRPFTVGFVNAGTNLEGIFQGFKAGMSDLGYSEGANIIYRHNPALIDSQEAIDREIKNLLSDGVDILCTISNKATMRAKKITEGTGVPVLFGLVADPVKNEFVESIAHPGGNMTGAYSSHPIGKSIEWMIETVPDTKFVYMPYYRDDQNITPFIGLLEKAAGKFGIEIYPSAVQGLEEIIAETNNLPENSAIIVAPKPWLENSMNDFFEIIVQRKIPVCSFLPSLIEKTGVLTTVSGDSFLIGKQIARLADQILKGTSPRDLPAEKAEFSLGINLKTAEAIGLEISGAVLLQADKIVR